MQADGEGPALSADVLGSPGHLVSLVARGFARLGEIRLKPLGFGVGYVPVLTALREGGAVTQRDLADLMRVEQPSMAQMLARMERDGFVARTPDPNDRRSSRIKLTPAAEARLPAAVETVLHGNREVLDGFTREEAELLLSLLKRVGENLDRLTGQEPPTTRTSAQHQHRR